jgi:hypothetical protein
MPVMASETNDTEHPGRAAGPSARMSRRLPPWAIAWGVPFVFVLGVLLIRNAFLFSTPEHEDADMGANSILIEQARRFTLLVGNYSREGFNHPGPAFLYVQSWGESLFYDVLHVVPTAWNGQLIAVYGLNAVFAASVVAVGYGWTQSVRGAAVTLAAVMLFGWLHPSMFSSDWMPYAYMPAYFAFVVAIASVAAGRTQDSWIAALSGWFLINGHACFLFIVPVLAGSALACLLWRWMAASKASGTSDASDESPGEAGTRRWLLRLRLPRPSRRVWVPVVVISAVLAFPMIVELALHWPGNFGKYFGYSSSTRSGGHGAMPVVRYVLWFWWPHAHAWAVAGLLVVVAALLTWRLPGGPLRRFCWSLLAADALSTAAFVAYAAIGIDALNEYYIGYFYWCAPAVAVLVIALSATGLLSSATSRLRVPAGTIVAAVLAVAACVAFAVAPQTRLSTDHVDVATPATGPPVDPLLPAAVAAMAKVAAGRPAIIAFDHNAWPAITGMLVQAERTGVTACVANKTWAFVMTSQLICTPAERANGREFYVHVPGQLPRGGAVVARLRRGIVTAGGK